MEADTVDRRDLYSAADLSDKSAEAFVKLVIRSENGLCFPIKHLARRGKLHFTAASNTFEKPAFEFFFECAYLLADRGLGYKVSLGSERETLKVDEIAENFKGLNMHFLISYAQ